VRWLPSSSQFLQAMADLALPPGDGFAWCAGEAAAMARVRELLLAGKGHPREHARIAAYWKRGATAHHENLE